MTEAATFYCDESGNTGVNWADQDQPIFAYAGWLVPRNMEGPLTSALDSMRAAHRIQGTELKWSKLSKRANGAAIFREAFDFFLRESAVPFCYIADKDYQTAAKLVETYFDPEYNKRVAAEFSGNFRAKKRLAEIILGDTSILRDFAQWIHKGVEPPADAVLELAAKVRERLTGAGATIAAYSLSDLDAKGIADIQHEFTADVWLRTTTGHTLFALLQQLEGFLRPRAIKVEIVHDELVRFDQLFGMIRGLFRQPDGTDVRRVGESLMYFSMPTVTGLRLANSKDEPLIQAADLLAGFLRTVFTKLKLGQHLVPDEQAVIHDLAMIHEQWYTWDANLPDSTWAAFARAAFPEK